MKEYSEYETKLQMFHMGAITKEEWEEYCFGILEELLEENKDIMERLRER